MSPKEIKLDREELDKELLPFLLKNGEETYVRHFLCWSTFPVNPFGKSEGNTLVNLQYRKRKEMYETNLKEKDCDGIQVLLDKHTKMEWFLKNYKKIYKDVGDEKYYRMLSDNLTYVDNHDLVRKHYSKMIFHGNDYLQMMSKKERKQFDKLPNKLTVYRGTSSEYKITPSNLKKL